MSTAGAAAAAPSLRDIVRDDGPLPASSVRTLAVDLARALSGLHLSGAVGCLSPDAVLLGASGPSVPDTADPNPAYLSPEQTRAEDVVPPTDIFALGACLAYAATGRDPFGEGAAEVLAYRIAYHDPDLDGIPSDLGELIASCLAKSPADRPTATDITLHTFEESARLLAAHDDVEPGHLDAADPRAALLVQAAGSMRAVLTNRATAFAVLRDRQARPGDAAVPAPREGVSAPKTVKSRSAARRSRATADPLDYRCTPRTQPTDLGRSRITDSARRSALLGLLAPRRRDILTVDAQGLQIRQRDTSADRRRQATYRIPWSDLNSIHIAVDKKCVRVFVMFAVPHREAWFQDNNVRRYGNGYEIFKLPCKNRQEIQRVALRIRGALGPYTEGY